ncbi:peptidoglycan-binding domain-containing protein [Kitasatospora sp. NBC_00070]|uniref:peptidoglycan-binding domain-containing protein n=1 Tax=Kitasatospora sp. NBC_00070 TaxID=2975962 RepID=UPI002F91A076
MDRTERPGTSGLADLPHSKHSCVRRAPPTRTPRTTGPDQPGRAASPAARPGTALAAAIALSATTPAAATARTTALLAVGSQSAAVTDLQRQLNTAITQLTPLEADGDFGPLTRDAVTLLQTCAGLQIDGVDRPAHLQGPRHRDRAGRHRLPAHRQLTRADWPGWSGQAAAPTPTT